MRFFVAAIVLAGSSSVFAQTTAVNSPVQKPMVMPPVPNQRPRIRQTAPPGRVPGGAKTATVAPDAPVVTLKGVCKVRQANTACETVITREELDRLTGASTPDVSKARSRQALQNARTLAFAALAEQQGLARDPVVARELEVQLKLVRTRLLANAFLERMQKQAPNITETEIQKYFSENRDQYEQVDVRRIAVPVEAPIESGRHLDRSAVKAEMEQLRSRAVAGEDLNQLQQDAYEHLHIRATPPPVNVLTLRRGSVQADEWKAFDMDAGEISPVLDLPAAYAIVKVESKGPMPIESVRHEIEAALRRDHLQEEVSKRTKDVSAQFNLEYFELPSQPDIFGLAAASLAANRGNARPAATNQP